MNGPQPEPVRPEDLADASGQLRGVLAEIVDPDSEVTATAATRRRVEGAVRALDAVGASARTAETT